MHFCGEELRAIIVSMPMMALAWWRVRMWWRSRRAR